MSAEIPAWQIQLHQIRKMQSAVTISDEDWQSLADWLVDAKLDETSFIAGEAAALLMANRASEKIKHTVLKRTADSCGWPLYWRLIVQGEDDPDRENTLKRCMQSTISLIRYRALHRPQNPLSDLQCPTKKIHTENAMKEKCTNLTREQCEFACNMMCQWMNICEDNNRGSSSADVDHSALLRRMLMGGKIYQNPPPKRYSYPCWALVEEEEIEIQDMHEYDIDIEGMKGTVVVDQAREYEWVDKENKIIRHTRLGIEYQYSEREVTPDVGRLRKGLNPEDHKYTGRFLKRLNDLPTGKKNDGL